MSSVLALDIATSCGFSVASPNGGAPIASGTWRLPDDNLDRALAVLRENVGVVIKTHDVKVVIIEAPLVKVNRFFGGKALIVLLSLQAVAREVSFRNGCAIHLVPIKTWRAAVLGNGNLSTDDAKAAAMAFCKQIRWPFDGHDNAEAHCLAFYYLSTNFPQWRPS